jgi:hypothetical protein
MGHPRDFRNGRTQGLRCLSPRVLGLSIDFNRAGMEYIRTTDPHCIQLHGALKQAGCIDCE